MTFGGRIFRAMICMHFAVAPMPNPVSLSFILVLSSAQYTISPPAVCCENVVGGNYEKEKNEKWLTTNAETETKRCMSKLALRREYHFRRNDWFPSLDNKGPVYIDKYALPPTN